MPKISALPAASTLVGTEIVPVLQSGTTKQATVNQLFGTTVVLFSTYTAFRAYTGIATTAYMTDAYLGGMYIRTPSDSGSSDNGGVFIVDGSARRWKRVYNGMLDPRWFGAVADNVTNDRVALQSALSSAVTGFVNGGNINIGSFSYATGASGGKCLSITLPTNLSGNGGLYSSINPSFASATDDTVVWTPSTSFDHTQSGIDKIDIGSSTTGTRTGRYGVLLDTQVTNALLPMFSMRDSIVGQGSNWGVYHLNNPTNNIGGGMYCGLFEHNAIKGGLILSNSGDSNSIVHNSFSGTGYVYASLVTGSSLLEIQANNITTSFGAIRIDAGSRFRVIGNNAEHSSVGAVANNDSAVFDIKGANGVMYGGVVKENLLSAFSLSDATTLLRLANCKGTLVEDNVFLNGASASTAITIENSCNDIRVGANTYNASIATQVNDSGIGTMGVVKTATLLNSWVAFAVGTQTLKYIKSTDGMVHLTGCIKNGTITNGTNLMLLPVGFRPAETIRAHAMFINAGTPIPCEINIDNLGNVSINYVTASTQMNINITFAASNLANGTSAE